MLFRSFLFISGCFNLTGIKTLIGIAKNGKLKQEELDYETQSFNKLKDYIEKGEIRKGLSQKFFLNNIGKPVVSFYRDNKNNLVYKPGAQNWFSGEKIYLQFDRQNKLIDWQCVNCK